nr:MAG TPA: hypothetical protein [Caudoviricetes sp.]
MFYILKLHGDFTIFKILNNLYIFSSNSKEFVRKFQSIFTYPLARCRKKTPYFGGIYDDEKK